MLIGVGHLEVPLISMTTNMANKVVHRKGTLQVNQFKTALARTLTTMGLERLKPKQVK